MALKVSSNLSIAAMRRKHLRAVLAVEKDNYVAPWPVASFVSELLQTNSRYYIVAMHGNFLVGYGGLMVIDSEEAHINTLTVDVQHHRQGIGTALLMDMVKEAIDREVNNLTLEVRASNEAAQALYRRFGFVPVGVRKGYYEETHEDAIIMWANSIRDPEYTNRLALIESRLSILSGGR